MESAFEMKPLWEHVQHKTDFTVTDLALDNLHSFTWN